MTTALQSAIRSLVLSIANAEEPPKRADYNLETQTTIDTLQAVGFLTVANIEDTVGVTTEGRLFAGLRPDGVPDLAVQVAEVTGNVEERELAARYMEEKIRAIDNAISKHQEPQYWREMSWAEAYEHIAFVLRAAASEFRMGLHIPAVVHEGRVIPYNEDRSTGISHAASLTTFFRDVYERNLKAGWWTDIATGQPKKRSVGELFMLFVTEIAEAYEAYRANAADDKLPEYPGLGVELADLGIRWADFCGAYLAGNIVANSDANNPGDRMFQEVCMIARHYEAIRKTPEAIGEPETADHLPPADVAAMVDAKLDFNAKREDHKIENRLKEDGKRT